MEPEWKEVEDEEQDEEEEFEEEFEEDESIDDTFETSAPASFTPFKRGGEQTSPFLESEPVESLEQELANVPSRTTTTPDEEEAPAYAETNAPFYSEASGYDSVGYENVGPRRATEMDTSGGALTSRGGDIANAPQTRRLDFASWQDQAMQGYPGATESRERDYTPAPAKTEQEGWTPFKRSKTDKFDF